MDINIFNQKDIVYQNDLDDFKMPYKLAGKTDIEVMAQRYLNLNNNSHGLIVRLYGALK